MKVLLTRMGLLLGFFFLIVVAYVVGLELTQRKTNPTPDSQIAQNDIDQTVHSFIYTTDPAARIVHVDQIKDAYLAATSSLTRARAINILIGFAHSAHEPYIYDEIFKGQPFSSIMTPNNEQKSLADLALYSSSIHPTAYAAQIVAQQYSSVFFDTLTSSTSVQSQALRKQASDALLTQYTVANTLIGSDLADAGSFENSMGVLIAFYQWQAHLLGDLSYYDISYLDDTLQDLNTGITLAENYDTEYHTTEFTQLIAGMLYSYGKYSINGGPAYLPAAQQRVDKLADLLTSHPELYPQFFIMFKELREIHSNPDTMPGMSGANTHRGFMEEIAGRIQSLSAYSGKMKQLLTAQGL